MTNSSAPRTDDTPAPASRPATVLGLIGNTPLLPLRFEAEGITLWAKAEYLNPSGSIKDRLAKGIIEAAEAAGQLRPGSTILECTSGNTGIALAMVGAVKGYRVHILMTSSASVERRYLIEQFGGIVELFEPVHGYQTGIDLAKQRAAADPSLYLPLQFENPFNAQDHELFTAREILAQTGGKVDAFVAGFGTGGTLSGCGKGLAAANPRIRIVAMEPAECALLSGEMPCCHLIEGVSGRFIPPLLSGARIDGVEKVKGLDAMAMTRRLSREFGLLVGTSSGANVLAALRVAAALGPDATVVTILCDRAERYYSTRLFRHLEDSAAS
jgi:cysteine synthase